MKRPKNPEDVLRRVLRVARGNGRSVAVVAGLCALVSLLFGDLVGASIGALVSAGGFMELAGRRQLVRGDPDGMRRLVKSQWFVLGIIVIYAVTRMVSFDADSALGNLTPGMRNELSQAGIDVGAILPMIRLMFYAFYGSVALATLVYQGGLSVYYRRRTETVRQALAARLRPVPPPRPPVPPPAAKDDWTI